MSSKKYKLAIADVVIVQVSGELPDATGKRAPFSFSFTAKRTSASEVSGNSSRPVIDILKDVITDVRDQRLVLQEDNTPAPFDSEMLSVLLDISGVAMLCYMTYLKEQSAAEKN